MKFKVRKFGTLVRFSFQLSPMKVNTSGGSLYNVNVNADIGFMTIIEIFIFDIKINNSEYSTPLRYAD